MKFKFSMLILLFAGMGTAFSQTGTIKGKVRDGKGNPLEFVTIGIQGTSIGTSSTEEGEYQINNVTPGSYTLFASLLGFEKLKKTVRVTENEVLLVDFSLEESSTALQEVWVTDQNSNRYYNDSNFIVAKLPLKDLENPQVYNSIPQSLIRDQVATDLNDALKNATGVTRLWESTGRGGDGAEYYTMRGFSVQPTIVNGMPSISNSSLDPANVDRIDVIKGPSGTLFGSPLISYGGLINITTKKPLDNFRGEVGYITGSYGLNRLTADVNLPVSETTSFRFNSAYQNENTFQDAGGRRSFFVAPSLKFKASERLTFLINTEFLDVNSVNAPMLFLNRNNPLTFSSLELFDQNYERSFTGNELSIRNTTFNIQAQAFYQLSPNWTSQTVLSRSATKTDGYYHYLFDFSDGDTFGRFISDRNGQTVTTDFQQNFIGNFQLGNFKNKFIAGVDYFQSSIFNGSTGWVGNGLVTLSDGKDTGILTQAGVDDLLKNSFEGNSTGETRVMSAYFSDVIELHPKFSMMASLRVDNFSGKTDYWVEEEVDSQTALSPKFGLVYQPIKDKVSIFGNYMNGFVNIAPISVADADGTNSRLKAFEPEQANQTEFGIKTNLLKNRISATASIYQIIVSNRVMNDPNNINNSIQGAEVESKGFEFSLVANPIEGLNIIAGYSHNDTKVTKDNPESGYLGLRPEESGPANLFNFWANYLVSQGQLKGFGLGFGANAAGEHLTLNRANIGSFVLPAYQVYNAALSYTGNQYMLALKVNNLTNQKYYSGWSTVSPQQLRNIAVSLNYKF